MSRKVDQLPPLTPAELTVLGPRYHESVKPHVPVRAVTPDDPSHTCGDSIQPCPACEAAEIEALVESGADE